MKKLNTILKVLIVTALIFAAWSFGRGSGIRHAMCGSEVSASLHDGGLTVRLDLDGDIYMHECTPD